MYKVYNGLNAHKRQPKGQIFTMPSMAIPDQTMSMREILERYTRGLEIEGSKTPIFEEEDEESNGINMATLDLVDIQEMAEENFEKIKELKNVFGELSKREVQMKKQEENELNELKMELKQRKQAAKETSKQ